MAMDKGQLTMDNEGTVADWSIVVRASSLLYAGARAKQAGCLHHNFWPVPQPSTPDTLGMSFDM